MFVPSPPPKLMDTQSHITCHPQTGRLRGSDMHQNAAEHPFQKYWLTLFQAEGHSRQKEQHVQRPRGRKIQGVLLGLNELSAMPGFP